MLIGNQMVYSWNEGKFHLRFLQILKISWAFFTHDHLITHTNIILQFP